jgi:hypothetical protein
MFSPLTRATAVAKYEVLKTSARARSSTVLSAVRARSSRGSRGVHSLAVSRWPLTLSFYWLSAYAAKPLRRDIAPQLALNSHASEGG